MRYNSEETLVAMTDDLKNGVVLNPKGQLWQVVEFQHVKFGKGPVLMRTRIKGVLSGKTVNKTFNAGLKIETAAVNRRDIWCLYKNGDDYIFMDVGSCEQTYVPSATIDEATTFMLESQGVIIVFHEDSVLFAELPASVVLTISHTESGLQGDRSSTGTKPVTIETGAEVQVLLFLNTSDKAKMNTRSGSHISRVNDW